MSDQPDAHDPDSRVLEDVRELDRLLSHVRFEPRASLGPEVLGRLHREEEPARERWRRFRQGFRLAALTLALSLAVFFLWATVGRTTKGQMVDQCCFDLDGGGDADDGVLVEAGRNESVRNLTIYEDRDGSGGFSRKDLLRFVRGPALVLQAPAEPMLTAFRQCCRDYDGGGKDDDGVLVLGVPPDRVLMASIYDTRKPGDPRAHRGPVRPALR